VYMVQDGVRRTAAALLAGRSDLSVSAFLEKWPEHFSGISPDVVPHLEAECRYSTVLERQRQEVLAFKKDEGKNLPVDLDYWAIPNLSIEDKEKLSTGKPLTFGAASRIPGVTPTALLRLLHLTNKENRAQHS